MGLRLNSALESRVNVAVSYRRYCRYFHETRKGRGANDLSVA